MNESGPTLKGVNVLKCNSQFCAITEKALLRQIGCQNLILYHHHTSKEYYTISWNMDIIRKANDFKVLE